MTHVVPSHRFSAAAPPSRAPAPLTIALVNNMPDGALEATERQFRGLIDLARDDRPVDIRVYAIAGEARGEVGARYCAARCRPLQDLLATSVDALIVTGCEPRAATLLEEPFWPELADLIDWAQDNTRSAIWSCLAAHAAALRLDGIERRRLPTKLSGVFGCDTVAESALTYRLVSPVSVPHSRWNGLGEDDLTAAGYTILTRSDAIGVDCFVKRMPSLFVFFQGHPEYDADTLGREYVRDLDRFAAGRSPTRPVMPANYFTEPATGENAGPAPDLRPPTVARWRPAAVTRHRNWLAQVAAAKLPDAITRLAEAGRAQALGA